MKDGTTKSHPCGMAEDTKTPPPTGPPATPTVDKVPPYQGPQEVNSPATESETLEGRLHQLPNSELPDPTKHLGRRAILMEPGIDDCQDIQLMNLKLFSSTWLALSAKNVDIKQHINFTSVVQDNEQPPICESPVTKATMVDHLPAVKHRSSLDYKPESGLKEVLQKLSGRKQNSRKVAARIGLTLRQNQTSWVAANMAALFWRVEGNAERAIDCILMALRLEPVKFQDITLLSLANVLHRAGYINDAIAVINMALDLSSNVVVSHFTMANLYAAKGDLDMAAMFYESTLGLQATFEPAKQRLRTIQCINEAQKTKG